MIDLGWLSFLAEPAFVLSWYLFGLAAAAWALWDMNHANTPIDKAVKYAWPVIILFFAPLGLVLYLATSRPPGIGKIEDRQEKMKAFADYSESTFRKVTASVIHCVGGDGLGIVTAMVVARISGMSFWQEYWLEYAVGFAFGWFIFQYVAMRMMTDSKVKALLMGGRGEFFSMLTVMAGMGLVMGYVTPLVVGEQPKPTTFAFWGFASLGLLVGFVATFPMNWLLVEIGWKHGIGTKAKQHLRKMEAAA